MASVTVTSLVTQTRQRADLVKSRFVTDAEVASYVDSRNKELFALLVKHSLIHAEAEQAITADGSAYYALPDRYFGTLDVMYDQGSNTEFCRLPRLSHRERPRTTGTSQAVGYRITGDGIVLYPAVTSGSYKHYYITSPLQLVETVSDATTETATVNYPMGWEEFIILGAAIDCLSKEETVNGALNSKFADMQRRILDEASMREMSEAPTVQNVDREGEPGRVRGWATPFRRGRR